MAQIYAWRTDEKLGIKAITRRLNASPDRYPPADPAAGWSLGGVAAILRNPKYTGYQVFGRRRMRFVPIEQSFYEAKPKPTVAGLLSSESPNSIAKGMCAKAERRPLLHAARYRCPDRGALLIDGPGGPLIAGGQGRT